jgi:hypothetical protein
VGVLLAVGGCSRGAPGAKGSGPGAAPPGPPLLDFEHPIHDAGVFWRQPPPTPLRATHAFPFVNRTEQPVTITKVVAGCDCAQLRYPKEPIPPGGKGEVTFGLNLDNRSGPFQTRALVFLENDEAKRVDLTYVAFLVDPPQVSPRQLDFGEVPAGKPVTGVLTLRVPLSPEEKRADVVECAGKADEVHYEVRKMQTFKVEAPPPRRKPVKPQDTRVSQFEVAATLSPREPGKVLEDTLTLKVQGHPQAIQVKVQARVRHPRFTAVPARVNFGPVDSRGAKRLVTLRSTSEGPLPALTVAGLSPSSGTRAWLEPSPDDRRELRLWLEARPGASAFLDGAVRLKVDDPEHGDYSIPYTGYIVPDVGGGPKP